jgi:chromosomal replication initiation ATPase DnaA
MEPKFRPSGICIAERLNARGLGAVVALLCATWNVTSAELLGPSHVRRIVNARKALYVELRARGFSYPDIGYLTGRDHSTVLVGVRTANGLPRRAKALGAS